MRQQINLNIETCKTLFESGHECGYEIIENTLTYYDGEKNSIEHTVIIQRMFDCKYFKGRYIDYGRGEIEYDNRYSEVIPKQIITTVYE